MTTQTETHRFQAEVQELLGLMIHSLYTDKDIFLRELISNASDALDTLRIEALTTEGLLASDEELGIHLEIDPEARTLAVTDNGIGMTREELATNLGTIARSGTRAFLERLKKSGGDGAASLIGQFGVGFYSAFMVADEVVVTSRKAGESHGARWASKADGTYTLEDAEVPARGTTITLHLKPRPEGEDGEAEADLLDGHTVQGIVKRHSDFVEFPIRMEVEEWDVEKDADGKPKPDGERTKVMRTQIINSQKPLWARPKKEISEEEYTEFYRHIAHDWNEPARVIHVSADVPVEFTALLYVPRERQPDFLESPESKSRIALYVRRVLIMADCSDLLPPWLRFVRGVVECPDLPLNVSRQTLQDNPILNRIRKHLTSQVLKALGTLLEKERETHQGFFEAHGRVLKEGIYHGADDENRISRLCLFASSAKEGSTTLGEYTGRMPVSQEAIWYLSGMDKETAAASPHLETYREKEIEVLLMSDPVDEWMLQRLESFEEKPLKAIDRGEVDLGSEEEKKTREAKQESHKDLLEAIRVLLEEEISEVRFSARLKDSAAILVSAEGAVSPAMERVMREVQGGMPKTKRILELNPDHALVSTLDALYGNPAQTAAFESYAHLLHGQALIAEGSPVSDPAGFAALVTGLMVEAKAPQADA